MMHCLQSLPPALVPVRTALVLPVSLAAQSDAALSRVIGRNGETPALIGHGMMVTSPFFQPLAYRSGETWRFDGARFSNWDNVVRNAVSA